MDPIASPPPDNQIKPSDGKIIAKEIAKEDHIIEVPHIDFVLRDRPILPRECVQMVAIQELNHHFIRARINAKSSHQNTQHVKPHLSWTERSSQTSKPSEETEDQPAN